MLELLNQLDGFDTRGDVKVIMATNKIESLDPALIRPGRIDRKIEFPLPDVKVRSSALSLLSSVLSPADCHFFSVPLCIRPHRRSATSSACTRLE